MIIQKKNLVFLFILYSLSICCCVSEPDPTPSPTKTKMDSVKDCSNPIRPYAKNSPMVFRPILQNVDGKNTLGGNLTILKDTKDVTVKIKSFIWRKGQWYQSRMFGNLNCRGLLLHLTFKAFQVKYDKNNCMFLKGDYSFRDIDVNLLQHIWAPAMPHGRGLWRVEAYSDSGMFVCKEFLTITEPVNKG